MSRGKPPVAKLVAKHKETGEYLEIAAVWENEGKRGPFKSVQFYLEDDSDRGRSSITKLDLSEYWVTYQVPRRRTDDDF